MTLFRVNFLIKTVYDSILLTHWQKIYSRHQSSDSVFDEITLAKKLFFSKAFDEDEKISCQSNFFIQCCNTAANKWKKEKREKEYDRCWWEIDEDDIKELVKKKFEKKKKNSRYMMFEDLVVKNSNARTSAKHYINDTTSFSSVIENFSFKSENISEKESDV